MNAIELAGRVLGYLPEFLGDELKTFSLKSRDYVTGRVSLYTVRLDDY
jgi:hypothetical protein